MLAITVHPNVFCLYPYVFYSELNPLSTNNSRDIKSHEGQQSINHQQFVAELVSPTLHSCLFKREAYNWRSYRYVRHKFVAWLAAGK